MTAESSGHSIHRTLEIKKAGAAVLYVTPIAQASLPPPLTLEVGDQECASSLMPIDVTLHKLRASDEGGAPVIIDVGQQAQVGRFRVFNDLILRHPPGTLDAVDTLLVAVVRSP